MLELGFVEDQEDRGSDVPGRSVTDVLNKNSDFNEKAVATLQRTVLLESSGATVTDTDELSVTLLGETTDPAQDWTLSWIKLRIHGGDNGGVYGVSSTSWASSVLTIVLDRDLRDQTATNRHAITVESSLLVITARDSSTSSYIDVDAAGSTAEAELGLPVTEVRGTVTSLLIEYVDPVLGWTPADLRRRKIKVGDTVTDTAGSVVATITDVSGISSGILGVEPIASDLSQADPRVISSYKSTYEDFEDSLEAWQTGLPPYDDDDLKEIDSVVGPILILETPSIDQINTAYAEISAYRTKLVALDAVLRGYSVSSVGTVDSALRTLIEHGHDRARELLLQSRIADYFSVTARTASYSRVLMDAGSDVMVEELNEPTMIRNEEQSEFDRFVAGYEEDEDPAYEIENEAQLPDVVVENFWPDDF
jgi:hypothetical protein